jgi:HK97 family phage major capsid protein
MTVQPLPSEFKAAIDDLGATWEAFKTAHTEQWTEMKKGQADFVTNDKLAKIDAALEAAETKKSALDTRLLELEKKAGRPAQTDRDEKADIELKSFNIAVSSVAAQGEAPTVFDADRYSEFKAAFRRMLIKGTHAAPELQQKDLMVVSDPDGGYLVPADLSGRIMTRLYETSAIRGIANVVTTSSDALQGINDLDQAGAGWVGEIETRSDTTTPQVGAYTIPVHEMFAQPRATQKLLDDAAVDVEAWLSGKVSDRFTRLENAAFVVGDGDRKPRGFASYTTNTTADATRTWGTLQHVNTGANGAFASSAGGDVLFDVIGTLKSAYLANAKWVARRSATTAVRKLKGATASEYLWQPGLYAGQPSTLLGYEVVYAEDLAALGTGSLSMAFGDFNAGYTIVDRVGLRVLRDPFTAKPYVRFYTTKRVGGGVVDFDAIKFVRFSA